MKLPRSDTRRYRILRAFFGRAVSPDELIASFGLFGFEWRSSLCIELSHLCRLGYLRGSVERYELTAAARQLLIEAGEEKVELVPPRRYNVYAQPELDGRTLRNPCRRVSAIEKVCSTHYCASDPIPFNENDE